MVVDVPLVFLAETRVCIDGVRKVVVDRIGGCVDWEEFVDQRTACVAVAAAATAQAVCVTRWAASLSNAIVQPIAPGDPAGIPT